MKKNLGFTRFEFYFVISAISIIILVAIQRYLVLAEDTRRLGFEILAKNFSVGIYNHRARWILAQQSYQDISRINIDGVDIQFSPEGWPFAVGIDGQEFAQEFAEVSIETCLSLWRNFLQNAPAVSFSGGDAYGAHSYHLNLPTKNICRFEFIVPQSTTPFYFDYAPFSANAVFHISSYQSQ